MSSSTQLFRLTYTDQTGKVESPIVFSNEIELDKGIIKFNTNSPVYDFDFHPSSIPQLEAVTPGNVESADLKVMQAVSILKMAAKEFNDLGKFFNVEDDRLNRDVIYDGLSGQIEILNCAIKLIEESKTELIKQVEYFEFLEMSKNN